MTNNMSNDFGLPYLEAIITKALEIVKRDAELFTADENVYPLQMQVEHLLHFYLTIDSESISKKLTKAEGNSKILQDEAEFIIKHYLIKSYLPDELQNRVHFLEHIRAQHLMSKYKLKVESMAFVSTFNVAPIRICFPELEYKLKAENPSFCGALPDSMKKFTNFKKTYYTEMIFGLLPSGKKYGGFIKAYLHLSLHHSYESHPMLLFFGIDPGVHCLETEISKLRGIYNSSLNPNEKRIQWFANLGIRAEDLALWTRLFDEQYPGYKQVHKLFHQVA